MPTGRSCQSPAMRESAYCYFHARRGLASRSNRARNQLKLPVLDSPQAIRTSVAEVANGILAGTIDARRAGRILYGIQIASAVLDRTTKIPRPTQPAPVSTPSQHH